MLLNSRNLSLTLFVSMLLTLAVTSVEAHDFAQPNRRTHDNLKRLVRKRSPFPDIGSDLGLQNDVPDPNAPNSASAIASAPSVSAASSGTASAALSTSSASALSSAPPSLSTSATALSSASASATSAPPSTTTTSTSTTATTTAAVPTTPAAQQAETPATGQQTKSTITQTASVLAAAAAQTNTVSPSEAAATKTKFTITTVIIVVAASVGGLAILWTIFRKWKLGSSSKFSERMAPIDWQPTNDEGIVPAHRRTNSRASSFTSSATHDNGARSHLEHDFAAPTANLAPVGGYADLARGSSPQPQMQEALGRGPSMRSYNDGLARGPSTTRPAYDTGVPLHHQAGYGQAEAYDYNGDAVRF
ncbi:hypothetical protein B0H11DRAFT_2013279 [Mycena galericulata]|nr:hypothetical protein B0H11DRAFT_2013279 [Mycena galericulata]